MLLIYVTYAAILCIALGITKHKQEVQYGKKTIIYGLILLLAVVLIVL